jgi:hypothetical protein
LLTSVVVTGIGDTIALDGVGTLREAITAANTNAASGDAPAGTAGRLDAQSPEPGRGKWRVLKRMSFGWSRPCESIQSELAARQCHVFDRST